MLFKEKKTVHDLRNAMASAISCIEYVLFEDDPEVTREVLEVAKNSLNDSIELSENLSHYFNKICKEEKIKPKEGFLLLTLQAFLREHAMPGYERLRKKHRIKIFDSYSLLDEPKYLYANPSLLDSVRSNIISNAENAGSSEIRVHFEMKEHYITISFVDNGPGMSQEDIDAVYAKQHGDGVVHGIGTSIIIDALKEHGVHAIYRTLEGQGCSIRVICPYLTTNDVQGKKPAAEQPLDVFNLSEAYC